jgi:hypothetical protein
LRSRLSNRQKLANIVTYVNKNARDLDGSVSAGEIEEQLGYGLQLQYTLFRAYGEFFPELTFSKYRWKVKDLWQEKKETVPISFPVPQISQETLSAQEPS